MKLQLHCFLHRAPIQLFPSPQAFSHPYVHITSSLLFILYCSDFKTVLSPFESLPLEPFIQSRMVRQHFAIFSELPAPSVARRVALSAGSRASATWRGTYTWASAGVETPPEKGRPRLYVPVGNSVLMPHGVSFHVDVPPLYVKLPCHTYMLAYTYTFASVQSRAVRLDTKLCWIACRDLRVTWRDTRVRIGSARRSRAQMY